MSRQSNGRDSGLTSFVGRRHDLAEGRRLLGGSRLVTLVGPGGVGKTRLALRLAEEVSRAFADGTFVVELAELNDSDELAGVLARSLGVEDVGTSPEAAVASFIGDRRVLLVLDNCEHLVEPAAALVHGLLRGSPGLRVLATSRQPLGVVGEQLMTVDPLSLPAPAPGASVVRAEDSEAVELFVERARLVVPHFSLTPENADLVSRVCTTLDGMPLAIELAAARLRLLSLGQLAERLDDRFGVLAVAATAALPRHQTLRASVDWSFDLCSPEEQTLWAWMSVFEGGCDLDAAEAVCSEAGINVFETVAALVDKSVLIPREAAGRVRYRMLETIGAYGRERLTERGEADQLAERHRAYFVSFAKAAGNSWFGPDQRDTMARTAAEHANLRAAFECCLATPGGHQDALVLCTSIWWFWVGRGSTEEVLRWLRRALNLDQPSSPLTLHALSRATLFAGVRGDYDALGRYAERAAAMDIEGSPATRWDQAWARSLLHYLAGDLASSIQVALDTLRGEHPPGAVGQQEVVNVLSGLAQRELRAGRREEAVEHLDEGIEICRRHGDEWTLSFLLCTRGAGLTDLERYDAALDAELEALRLARDDFHGWTVAHALETTARIYHLIGRTADAAVLLGALTRLWPDMGVVPTRTEQKRHVEVRQRVREQLDPSDFDAAISQGQRMGTEEVVSFVLDETPTVGPGPAARATEVVVNLSPRELQVAELVARGLSNKEIAQVLVVSPRTAEGHVARLLDKLGFDSRARVAAWVAERRAGGQPPVDPAAGN